MSVKEVLAALSEKINGNPAGINGLEATYQFDLSGENGGVYQVIFDRDKAEFVEGAPCEAKCTLELSDTNFIKLVDGELNPTTAFMMGKIKIKGDLPLSLKLQAVLKHYR